MKKTKMLGLDPNWSIRVYYGACFERLCVPTKPKRSYQIIITVLESSNNLWKPVRKSIKFLKMLFA